MDPVARLNAPAPLFRLPGLDGQVYDLAEQSGKITILNFWSAECPWIERADREVSIYITQWGASVAYWAIATNANEPEALLRQVAQAHQLPHVLRDEQHQVADLYQAQTTPHYFVVDGGGILRYRGASDDVNFRKRDPTRHYLREAVEALLAGRLPDLQETAPYGCSIVRYSL